jgi:hypothetical protein
LANQLTGAPKGIDNRKSSFYTQSLRSIITTGALIILRYLG